MQRHGRSHSQKHNVTRGRDTIATLPNGTHSPQTQKKKYKNHLPHIGSYYRVYNTKESRSKLVRVLFYRGQGPCYAEIVNRASEQNGYDPRGTPGVNPGSFIIQSVKMHSAHIHPSGAPRCGAVSKARSDTSAIKTLPSGEGAALPEIKPTCWRSFVSTR